MSNGQQTRGINNALTGIFNDQTSRKNKFALNGLASNEQ